MIKQVPTYAKFLKDLCAVKRGLHVTKKAFLTGQVSAIIQSKSPIKYKDPGCPTISVNIGGTHVEKALLNLGASVNLLPYSVYKQLGLGELKPTAITLSLADRLVKIPKGVIKDVLVQVDKFYYPVDFVVLDTDPTVKEANYVPIILGRPFLATSNAIINCRNGVIQLTFGNMTLELNIFHLCKRHLFCKPLPVNLKYAYLEEDEKWISPLVCTHHIYMEEDAKPVRQPQRRLSPHMQEVNEKGEEVSTRPTSGWRVCIDYRRLNSVTRKDHFPLPFMDQVLERVLGHPFYCFLDGYLGYFQIEIDLEDQEKTTFTCPFGTFAYRRMPLVYVMHLQLSKDECLLHLEVVLQRCIEKDLVLNWEKCHFMDAKFVWDEKCQKSFEELKQFLRTAPIVRAPNWKLPFEAQRNYTTTEKKLLAVVFTLDKFRAYLVGSSIVVFTNHSALKYLLTKQDAKEILIRWILLLQEFNLQIRDKRE
ncbi:Transposon Ty3-I Gag-Pol polyprotein [Vitis vinifera]|uniref:RNA-directed DNA polymerase n=1 Tax=Vitis vinifera TaxID=29760 RepID=A0A438CC61_VITVI|nr:Transposon Ty3-I Gag-Pol polyprotein [Vitis vinifera]